MTLLPVEVNCPGGCLRLGATGDFAGDPKHPLGSATLANDGQGNLLVSVDFSPIGSSSARVDIYDGPVFVGTANIDGTFWAASLEEAVWWPAASSRRRCRAFLAASRQILSSQGLMAPA